MRKLTGHQLVAAERLGQLSVAGWSAEHDAASRLDNALGALRYSECLPSHHRSNLLLAIQLFAGLNRDEGLVRACGERLSKIRGYNVAPNKL